MKYRLKELRKSKGLNQTDIAKLINVSLRQYRHYELENIDIPTAKMIILADYFGVSIDYLVGRTDV